MIISEYSLTDIANLIKMKFVAENIEGTIQYLSGPNEGDATLIGQIGGRIRHSAEANYWKQVMQNLLRTAPNAMLAAPAKTIINVIENAIRELERQDRPAAIPVGTDFISLGRALAEKATGACHYCFDSGEWFRYDEEVWVADKDEFKITELAEEMLLEYLQADPNNNDLKTAARSVGTIVKRARTSWNLSGKRTELDSYANHLNTPDGYFDLTCGDRERNSWGNYCANRTKVAPAKNWEDSRWAEFLEAVLPDKDNRGALQRMVGYTLLGERQDKAVFFLHGETNRGKSLLLNAIENCLGDYAITTTTDLWLKSAKNDYALADLPGKRLISCAEFDEDMRINTSLMKCFTGGEPIEARSPYGKPFRFKPQGTIIISTNKLPWLGSDAAAWSRMFVMPFTAPPVGSNRFSWENGGHHPLVEVLQSQQVASEILRWMMDGAEKYLERGIDWPETSVQAVEAEKEGQLHHAERWIKECLRIKDDGFTLNKELVEQYLMYALNEEHEQRSKILSASALGRKLRAAGYVSNPDHSQGRGWNAKIIKRYR